MGAFGLVPASGGASVSAEAGVYSRFAGGSNAGKVDGNIVATFPYDDHHGIIISFLEPSSKYPKGAFTYRKTLIMFFLGLDPADVPLKLQLQGMVGLSP